MDRHYCSFWVRCWSIDEIVRRVDVEQVQSGRKVRAPSVGAALEWMEICCQTPGKDSPADIDEGVDRLELRRTADVDNVTSLSVPK